MVASHFTYPRPVVDDIAKVIASVRTTSVWLDAQRITLDSLIDGICRDLEDNHEGFNAERFRDKAGYWIGRLQPHPNQEDSHHG